MAPEQVNRGDTFTCVVQVEGFVDITSGQFEIGWDPRIFISESVMIPVDSMAQASDFSSSMTDSSAIFLYVEQTASTGGTLSDGSELLSVELVAIGQPGDSSCIRVTEQRTATEFIELAQRELDVTDQKATVHLRGPVSTISPEQHKIHSYWRSASELIIEHPLAEANGQIRLYDISGHVLAAVPVDVTSTQTILRLSVSGQRVQPYVLDYSDSRHNLTLLIQGLR